MMVLNKLSRYSAVFALSLVWVADSGVASNARIVDTESGKVRVHPIEHASFVLEAGDLRIAFDPVGGAASGALDDVDLVLVTDIHRDHFNADTLSTLAQAGAKIVAPKAVAERMSEPLKVATQVLANGETTEVKGVRIKAIPMYNLTEERLKFHPKGRGNGYLLELNGLRIYVAGDTEDTPEMRALEDIDVAFIPLNLPFTMSVQQAADAVVEMHPDIVYPYHYRGKNGFSDLDRFAELVGAKTPDIEVRRLDWYP